MHTYICTQWQIHHAYMCTPILHVTSWVTGRHEGDMCTVWYIAEHSGTIKPANSKARINLERVKRNSSKLQHWITMLNWKVSQDHPRYIYSLLHRSGTSKPAKRRQEPTWKIQLHLPPTQNPNSPNVWFMNSIKLDRWPGHVTPSEKRPFFDIVTSFATYILGHKVDPITNVTTSRCHDLGHKVDPIRNVTTSRFHVLNHKVDAINRKKGKIKSYIG